MAKGFPTTILKKTTRKRKSTTSKWAKAKASSIDNMGVFASRDIPEGTKIIEYVGEKLTKKESDELDDFIHVNGKKKSLVYLFEINKRYDINGNVPWNTARWINHSCNPNCESDIITGKIWIIALRDIKKGEELSYDYGYDIEDFEDHPCKCGAKNCIGYIVDQSFWPKVKRKLAAKKAKRKAAKKRKK